MRVLYVNQTALVSGAEHSLLTLLEGLDGETEALAACPVGQLADRLRAIGVEPQPIAGTAASFRLHPLHTSRSLVEIARSSLQVRRIVGRLRPDLVYANTTRAALLCLLARRRRPPVLAHIRDRAPEGRFSRAVFRLIARRADAIVATSDYVARQFDGLAPRRSVRVINDPIDLTRFDRGAADGAAVRRELGISPQTVVLSVVGQLTPLKGQDVAIEALAGLRGAGHDVALLLVGSVKFAGAGTQLDNVAFGEGLAELATELGVGDRVHLLGERPDVPELLAATDVLLMPFWRDAFGRVAVEAMAMGIPVAASSVGGPAEIVRADVDGVHVPPKESRAWAAALAPLVADPELRARMGRSAERRARDFAVDVHTGRMLALYRELLA